MNLYHLHEWQQAALLPLRFGAELAQALLQNPFNAFAYTSLGRNMASRAAEVVAATKHNEKTDFHYKPTRILGKTVEIEATIVASTAFCNLIRFQRKSDDEEVQAHIAAQAKILLLPSWTGHYATLLRSTIEPMLPENDIFVLDWIDAKQISLAHGPFGLDEHIGTILEIMRHIGPDLHAVAIGQESFCLLCATALLAETKDPATPRSITLIGGAIDPECAKTTVSEFARTHDRAWYRNHAIETVPLPYSGAGRQIYPGFLQLHGYMSTQILLDPKEQDKMFRHLIAGSETSEAENLSFYHDYLPVMDVPAEAYLEMIERIFHKNDLARGRFPWRGQIVNPRAITDTAILVVEGDLDDITAPGQTRAALDLCPHIPQEKKRAHLEIGVGHYGLFYGKKWRNNILPLIQSLVRANTPRAPEKPSAEDVNWV